MHAEESKAAVEITAVAMDFVPHLWQDHGGAIEIPEEYWMEVNLVDNWLEHYNRSCPNLQADNDQTVSIVHVVAYVNLSNQGQGGQQSVNHWVLFLKLGPQKSVSLYMRLDLHPDPNRGKIEVASKPYVCTRTWPSPDQERGKVWTPSRGHPLLTATLSDNFYDINFVHNFGLTWCFIV